ncbi:MAG: DNA polymerase III subunit delta [Rhodobacteraceae bacterium]|nr:DNA polymerase III subunit delta [Paracoccaceae bacterium]
MKLSAREANNWLRKPDPASAGLLLFGGDPMRVALRRKEVITAMIGPQGEEEMRLTRMSAAQLRKDPALLDDALRAQGFFPGPRAVLVEDATDGMTKQIGAALVDWRPGDAQIIVTAGALAARSSLRKLFEAAPNTVSIALYDDPPSAEELAGLLNGAGLANLSDDARTGMTDFSRSLDPGDLRQFIEKLSLYKLGDTSPLSADDLTACAPLSSEAAMDELILAVAGGAPDKVGPLTARLTAQGTTPVSLCIMLTRHFRSLHVLASGSGGPANTIGRMRPPIWGPRRDQMIRQAGRWGSPRLEVALRLLIDTDLKLRSSDRTPAMAHMERHMIRLAMMAAR